MWPWPGATTTAALKAFDAALEGDASYVPALVGKGQTLLADDKTDLALAAFERALIVDPSLTDLNDASRCCASETCRT